MFSYANSAANSQKAPAFSAPATLTAHSVRRSSGPRRSLCSRLALAALQWVLASSGFAENAAPFSPTQAGWATGFGGTERGEWL
ncbi:hypothetical protein HLRTI_003240, partial [Halorhabdus tiamatea SARL4B]